MRRLLLASLAVLLLAFSFGLAARADDDEATTKDYKALEDWVAAQPKASTAEEQKAFRAECEKHFRAFLKDHPNADAMKRSVQETLANLLYNEGKYDDSLALYEALLKDQNEDQHAHARHGIVRDLIGKKDLKGARARLDAFLKDHADEEGLAQLDTYLKSAEAGKAVKPGAPAPALKGKDVAGNDFDLAGLAGKVVLVEFWTSQGGSAAPGMKELPTLQKVYSDLHAKGLEMVGVAIEKDATKFKAVVDKEKIAWPQLVFSSSDLQGVMLRFGVHNVPTGVLVGKDGKIVALDLRRDALSDAVHLAVEGKAPEKPRAKPSDAEPSDGE
jgi:peroxiredoxin